MTSTTPAASTTTGYNYVPPTQPPPLLQVPNSTCTVATDRQYSLEHIWVKSISSNLVVLGITTTFVAILGEPYKMTFPKVGQTLVQDDGFGEIEGYKVAADLISPVSGKVANINFYLKNWIGGNTLEPVCTDPYNTGWMVLVELTKADELKSLLSPLTYMDRLGKGTPVD
jgi:glycine cleavage system H protein